jgi:hypothetical protein
MVMTGAPPVAERKYNGARPRTYDFPTPTPKPNEVNMPRTPLVLIVGSITGGSGKTTTSCVLSDFIAAKGGKARIFDAEVAGAGDLKRFVSAADLIDIKQVDGQQKIFDGNIDGVTLVDLPAGQICPSLHDFDQAGLFGDVRAGRMAMGIIDVLSPSERSLSGVAEVAEQIKGARHFLVANDLSNEGGFAKRTANHALVAKLQKMQAATINMPFLKTEACDAVRKAGMSFNRFSVDPQQSRILRGFVKTWVDQVFDEFERVGLGELVAAAVLERPTPMRVVAGA